MFTPEACMQHARSLARMCQTTIPKIQKNTILLYGIRFNIWIDTTTRECDKPILTSKPHQPDLLRCVC